MCKKKKRLLNFHLCASVANFVLFASALCEGCRICIIRWAFLEFSGLTLSLLVIGADSVNFAYFTGVVGEVREIWLIRSNFPGFSVDGQRSES